METLMLCVLQTMSDRAIVPIVLERPARRDVVSTDTSQYSEWASFFVTTKIEEMRARIGQAGMWWI